MHGEVRTPVGQAQRLVRVRGNEVQAGSLGIGLGTSQAWDSSVTAVVEYFPNAARGERSAKD